MLVREPKLVVEFTDTCNFGDKIMRHILSFSIILAVCSSLLITVGCQEQTKTPATNNNELDNPQGTSTQDGIDEGDETNDASAPELQVCRIGPKITFAKELHDFGEIKPASKNNCEFTFTNTGDAELVIKEVTSPCRCTIPKLTKKKYAPGESGTIKAVYTASESAMRVSKTIQVSSNDQKRPKVNLMLRGKIVLPVRHTPNLLKLMLDLENAKCPNITLACMDDKPFAIKSINSTAGCITASFDPNTEQTKFVLEPKVDIAKLRKAMRGSITIKLNHPECPKVIVPYQAIKRFKLNPSTLIVQRAEPGKIKEHTIKITNNYNEDFEIESVVSEKGYIKLLNKVKQDGLYELKLQTIPPTPEEATRVFMDTLIIKIKNGEELTVYCRGWYSAKTKQ
jgi:hypothetical protein